MPQSLQSAVSFRSPQLAWLAAVAIVVGSARADDGQQVAWRTGADFQKQLRLPVSITWDEQPLSKGLQSLAQAQRTSVFLDRRGNPDQRVTVTLDDVPLETALRRIAREAQLGVGFVGPVIYVGPPLTCTRIATLAAVRNDQVKQLRPGSHRRLLQRSMLTWENLTEPRLLIAKTASSAGLTIPNIQSVPHDLWFAAHLPPMTFGEKATLMLAGFDMSFRFHENASQALLTRFPRGVSLEKSYLSSNPEKLARLLQSEFPQAFVELAEDGKSVAVKSTLEDHWKIRRIQGGERTGKTSRPLEKRYTMNVENKPVGPLLQLLAKKLDLRIEFSGTVTEDRRQKLVSAAVRDATPKALLQAMATPAELHVEIAAGVIYVSGQAADGSAPE